MATGSTFGRLWFIQVIGSFSIGNLLTLRKHAEMGNLDFSPSDNSVAFAYRVFHPGEPGPPSARFEIWSLKRR